MNWVGPTLAPEELTSVYPLPFISASVSGLPHRWSVGDESVVRLLTAWHVMTGRA